MVGKLPAQSESSKFIVQVWPQAEAQLEVGDTVGSVGVRQDVAQIWPQAEAQLEVGDTVGSVRVRQDVAQIKPSAEVELGRLQLLTAEGDVGR